MLARNPPPCQQVPKIFVVNKNVKAILWDFGGVIATSPFERFAAYESDAGLEAGTIRSLNSHNSDSNAWAHLERGELTRKEFCDLFEAEAEASGHLLDAEQVLACLELEVRPAMFNALKLCNEHYTTACLTNNMTQESKVVQTDRERLLENVMGEFDYIFASAQMGIRKPEPQFYLAVLRELGIEAKHAVFLDDLGVNLKPARALGMQTIRVADPHDALYELETITGLKLR